MKFLLLSLQHSSARKICTGNQKGGFSFAKKNSNFERLLNIFFYRQRQWIMFRTNYNEFSLENGLLMASMNRKNDYSKEKVFQ